jgi:5'-methylthioadenosine phosphorylase
VTNNTTVKIGIIGGSGLYDIDGLTDIENIQLDTPFGSPSDAYLSGRLDNTDIVFLPRHGRGHRILPSELNYQANIFGFKQLGVTHIISISAVGSLQEHLPPEHIVIPDQLIDRTVHRKSTFFGNGVVGHIPFSDPFCPVLSRLLYKTAQTCNIPVQAGGTLVTIEGPAFSTRAESRLYQSWGIDIIGMTTLQEAKLAREAQLCYAVLSMVTDYDCWREEEEAVNVETVMGHMKHNSRSAKQIIKNCLSDIAKTNACPCTKSLENAIMTDLTQQDKTTREIINTLLK